MEETRVCDICGREHPLSDLKEFDGVLLCESCWNSETIVCAQCGERIWLDDNEGSSETPLCGRCFDRFYTTCVDCGRTIHQDDAYYEDADSYTAIHLPYIICLKSACMPMPAQRKSCEKD